APIVLNVADDEMPDAVRECITLTAAHLAGVTEKSVGHWEARDLTVEYGVTVHGVRRIREEVAVVVLAADLERVLAPDEGKIPSCWPDVVAGVTAARARNAVGAKADIDQRVAEDLALIHSNAGTIEVRGSCDGLRAKVRVRGLIRAEAEFERGGWAEDVN